MSTNKFLTVPASGIPTLTTGISTSIGAGDANKLVSTDSAGKIDSSLMPVGIGAATESVVASEALNAGDLINFWNDAGTRKIRKADASNSRYAEGFVLTPVSSSATATAYLSGNITGLTGIVPGSLYFLSPTTAGGNTVTAPIASGQTIQLIGFGVSTTAISFKFNHPIMIA
jgi:hypothetical protein